MKLKALSTAFVLASLIACSSDSDNGGGGNSTTPGQLDLLMPPDAQSDARDEDFKKRVDDLLNMTTETKETLGANTNTAVPVTRRLYGTGAHAVVNGVRNFAGLNMLPMNEDSYDDEKYLDPFSGSSEGVSDMSQMYNGLATIGSAMSSSAQSGSCADVATAVSSAYSVALKDVEDIVKQLDSYKDTELPEGVSKITDRKDISVGYKGTFNNESLNKSNTQDSTVEFDPNAATVSGQWQIGGGANADHVGLGTAFAVNISGTDKSSGESVSMKIDMRSTAKANTTQKQLTAVNNFDFDLVGKIDCASDQSATKDIKDVNMALAMSSELSLQGEASGQNAKIGESFSLDLGNGFDPCQTMDDSEFAENSASNVKAVLSFSMEKTSAETVQVTLTTDVTESGNNEKHEYVVKMTQDSQGQCAVSEITDNGTPIGGADAVPEPQPSPTPSPEPTASPVPGAETPRTFADYCTATVEGSSRYSVSLAQTLTVLDVIAQLENTFETDSLRESCFLAGLYAEAMSTLDFRNKSQITDLTPITTMPNLTAVYLAGSGVMPGESCPVATSAVCTWDELVIGNLRP